MPGIARETWAPPRRSASTRSRSGEISLGKSHPAAINNTADTEQSHQEQSIEAQLWRDLNEERLIGLLAGETSGRLPWKRASIRHGVVRDAGLKGTESVVTGILRTCSPIQNTPTAGIDPRWFDVSILGYPQIRHRLSASHLAVAISPRICALENSPGRVSLRRGLLSLSAACRPAIAMSTLHSRPRLQTQGSLWAEAQNPSTMPGRDQPHSGGETIHPVNEIECIRCSRPAKSR
jgi:hypothetical protein